MHAHNHVGYHRICQTLNNLFLNINYVCLWTTYFLKTRLCEYVASIYIAKPRLLYLQHLWSLVLKPKNFTQAKLLIYNNWKSSYPANALCQSLLIIMTFIFPTSFLSCLIMIIRRWKGHVQPLSARCISFYVATSSWSAFGFQVCNYSQLSTCIKGKH